MYMKLHFGDLNPSSYPHTLQALILVERPPHQGRTVATSS